MESYSVLKKEGNSVIHTNMDEFGEHMLCGVSQCYSWNMVFPHQNSSEKYKTLKGSSAFWAFGSRRNHPLG